MAWRCPSPRVDEGIDVHQVLKIVSKLEYSPPSFDRLVLYTPQFCKVPFPGQEIGRPRAEYEARGYAVGELFQAEGYTLIDIDFYEHVDKVKAWRAIVEKLNGDYIVYPTVRGLHIYARGVLEPAVLDAVVVGKRARVEVKPCNRYTCTSWYRTLNAVRVKGGVLAVNGRLAVYVKTGSEAYRVIEFDLEPVEPDVVEDRLGLPVTSGYNSGAAEFKTPVYRLPVEMVKTLGSKTAARLSVNSFKSGLFALSPLSAEEILSVIDELHAKRLLPPCLEPAATGEHDDNRFATLTLLVAVLTRSGFGIREDDVERLCELLVERWGGSYRQCRSKLRSILVCFNGVCGYAYGYRLISGLAPLWSCDRERCPVASCPGPANPPKAVKQISSYLRKLILGARLVEGLRRVRL